MYRLCNHHHNWGQFCYLKTNTWRLSTVPGPIEWKKARGGVSVPRWAGHSCRVWLWWPQMCVLWVVHTLNWSVFNPDRRSPLEPQSLPIPMAFCFSIWPSSISCLAFATFFVCVTPPSTEVDGRIRIVNQTRLPGLACMETARDNLCCCSVTKSCPTLPHHGLQHAGLPCPSLSPRAYSNSSP